MSSMASHDGDVPTPLCRIDEVHEGAAKRIELSLHGTFAVFRIGGVFYATDDHCTHAQASLSEGEIDGEVVTCPAHFGAFHVPTGRAMGFPATEHLRVYSTFVENGQVFAYLCGEPPHAGSGP